MGIRESMGIRPFDRDRFMVTSRDEAARVAFGTLDRIQREKPEEAMMGAALLFAALCQRCNLDFNDAYQAARKMLRPEAFHQKANIHLEAIQDFAGMRILADPRVENPMGNQPLRG